MVERKISVGLRSPGTLEKKPIIGIIMFIIGSLIFAILAYSLATNGLLIKWDLPLADYFYALALQSSPLLINIMISGYYIGSAFGIIIVGLILGLYFLYKKFWRELVMVAAGFGGGGLLFELFSNIFNRPRPSLLFATKIWAGNLTIPGFPSGHTLSIVVCYGFLVYLFLPKIKSYLVKVLLITIALLLMLFVGFSRLYVGDHYLTDIIAGYAIGIAWFGLIYTSVELLFKKYEKRKEKLNNSKFKVTKK